MENRYQAAFGAFLTYTALVPEIIALQGNRRGESVSFLASPIRFFTKYSHSHLSGTRGGIFNQNMSLNGLDDPKVREAHETAVAEPGGWYVIENICRPFPPIVRTAQAVSSVCGKKQWGNEYEGEEGKTLQNKEERKTNNHR